MLFPQTDLIRRCSHGLAGALSGAALRPRCRAICQEAVFDDGITLLANFAAGESAGGLFLITLSNFWLLLLPGNLPGSCF